MKRSSSPADAVNSVRRLTLTLTAQHREILWSAIWIIGVCGVAFFWGLASTGLVDETEPLFAEAARQMYETGDWVTPFFNGTPRFDKPPLIYWCMAIAFHLWGVSEWAVRLPSAMGATVLVGFGFWTLRRFGGSSYQQPPRIEPSVSDVQRQTTARPSQRRLLSAAVIGSTVMALQPEMLVWGRIGVSDMVLTSCMGLALLAFFWGYGQPQFPQQQRLWFLLSYGLMGLAVLAKGPVGVVLPGLIILIFLGYVGQLGVLFKECQMLSGAGIFLIVTVPWYGLVTLANGQTYLDAFFGYHNVDRFTSVVNGHAAPVYFYLLVVAIGFLPWSPFLPWAIARLRFWQIHRWRQQPRNQQLGLFALVWLGVIFGFFTLAVTKLPSYVLPLMPAAAVLIGLAWSDLPTRPKLQAWGFWLSYGLNLLAFAVLIGAALYSPNWLGNDPAMADLPTRVRASGVMIRAAGIWGGALIAGIALLISRQTRWLWTVNGLAFATFLLGSILPTYQLADTVRQQPLRDIAQAAVTANLAAEPLFMTGFMKPSLVYYTQQPVTYIESVSRLRQMLQSRAEDEAVSGTALVVGTTDEITALAWPAEQQTPLLKAMPYQLVRIRYRDAP